MPNGNYFKAALMDTIAQRIEEKRLKDEKRKEAERELEMELRAKLLGQKGYEPEIEEEGLGLPAGAFGLGIRKPAITRMPTIEEQVEYIKTGLPKLKLKTVIPEIETIDPELRALFKQETGIELPETLTATERQLYTMLGRPELVKGKEVYYRDEKGKVIDVTGSTVTTLPPNSVVYALTKPPADIQKRGMLIANLSKSLSEMRSLIDQIPAGEGLTGRFIGGIEQMKATIGYNPVLKTYDDWKQVILGQIATTIGGETGSRLSDQDVKRMLNALPSAWNTETERDMKWKEFYKTANSVATAYKSSPIFDDEGNIITTYDTDLSKIKTEKIIIKKSREFNSEEEADAAKLPIGTQITIKGRKAVVR